MYKWNGSPNIPETATWRDSMRGGVINILSPSVCLLVTAIGEKLGLSAVFSSVIILVVWFGSFFYLIRIQFARRQRNADIFRAFWQTTILGIALMMALVAAMYFL